MMKRTLFESESAAAVRVRNVTAALLLALSAGCASNGGREAGAASASNAAAVTTDKSVAADAGVAAADSRRVRVSAEGVKAAEPSVAAAPDGAGESGSNGLWRVRLGGAATRGGRLNVAYVAQGGVWLTQADGVD